MGGLVISGETLFVVPFELTDEEIAQLYSIEEEDLSNGRCEEM